MLVLSFNAYLLTFPCTLLKPFGRLGFGSLAILTSEGKIEKIMVKICIARTKSSTESQEFKHLNYTVIYSKSGN